MVDTELVEVGVPGEHAGRRHVDPLQRGLLRTHRVDPPGRGRRRADGHQLGLFTQRAAATSSEDVPPATFLVERFLVLGVTLGAIGLVLLLTFPTLV